MAAEEISTRLQNSDTQAKNLSGSDQKVVLYAENGKEKYEFQISSLLYISSEGNYVEVFSQNEVVEIKLIRNSLKKTEEQLRDYPFILRCHRAYIVNINKITKTTGNAQGFKLTLENIVDKRIPVARSYTKQFKKLLGIS
jgi:DNA-binding LytR/AlgR family response regulator